MQTIAIRLRRGDDLKHSITKLVEKHNITAGVVLSAVGCLTQVSIRLAGAKAQLNKMGEFEILSLSGTLSQGGVHLHLAIANTLGEAFGGHLLKGNIIDTTCELVIGVLAGTEFLREQDETTGFKELVVN